MKDYEHADIASNFAMMSPEGDEWTKAWDALARDTVNRKVTGDKRAAEDSEAGECWQYMGTHYSRSHGGWIHDFRHRRHPTYRERLVWQIDAYYRPSLNS